MSPPTCSLVYRWFVGVGLVNWPRERATLVVDIDLWTPRLLCGLFLPRSFKSSGYNLEARGLCCLSAAAGVTVGPPLPAGQMLPSSWGPTRPIECPLSEQQRMYGENPLSERRKKGESWEGMGDINNLCVHSARTRCNHGRSGESFCP